MPSTAIADDTLTLTPDGPAARKGVIREAVLIGLLALTLNLVGNGRISLWDRDEPRYAGATREMRASGDWVHPTFNAEPRYHKPVLIYWLMLAGTALGGDNPFGQRLVSAVMGTGTVLLVWAWGRKILGERAGRLAALVLATAPIMVAESKLATTDATLTFFVVGCQFALWELSRGPSARAAAVFWTFLGLAVLTKSPAGPVLIGASAAVSWWCGGSLAFLKRLHWRWGPLVAAAIAVPWNVAILFRSQGEYYNVAVGYHIIRRATQGIEEHGGFPGYYVVIGLATFLPWSALIPAALVSAWKARKETPTAGFLLGWLLGPLILLECVRTKLIHYYLPAIPAAALLVGWFLARLADDRTRVTLRDWTCGPLALRTIAVSGVFTAVGPVAATWFLPAPLHAPLLALALLSAVGTAFVVHAIITDRTARAVRGLVTLSACSLAVGAGWLLPSAEPYRVSAVVGRRLASLEARVKVPVVLCTYQLPGTVVALGHPAPILRNRAALFEKANAEGEVLTALLPLEVKKIRTEPGPPLSLEVLETVEGFNVDKGRNETLVLAVVRPDGPAVTARPEGAARR